MTSVYDFLTIEVEQPAIFGWFHLMFFAITIAFTVFLCVKFRDCSDKTFKIITLIGWITILLLEIYKQIIYTVRAETYEINYDWKVFPYQLCSTPLYVLPIVAFMKDNKIRDIFTSYISTFSLVGGLIVMIYPHSVFVDDRLGIHIQTMVHHGLQVAFGVWFMVYNRKKADWKYFLKSVPLFLVLFAIAVLLNETLGAYLLSIGEEKFNMFFVSSRLPTNLPVLGSVNAIAPWGVVLVCYVLGLCVLSFVVFELMLGIILCAKHIKTKKAQDKNV